MSKYLKDCRVCQLSRTVLSCYSLIVLVSNLVEFTYRCKKHDLQVFHTSSSKHRRILLLIMNNKYILPCSRENQFILIEG